MTDSKAMACKSHQSYFQFKSDHNLRHSFLFQCKRSSEWVASLLWPQFTALAWQASFGSQLWRMGSRQLLVNSHQTRKWSMCQVRRYTTAELQSSYHTLALLAASCPRSDSSYPLPQTMESKMPHNRRSQSWSRSKSLLWHHQRYRRRRPYTRPRRSTKWSLWYRRLKLL